MKGKIFLQFFLYLCLNNMYGGGSQENAHSKKFIPYFRRQVEEMEENNLPEKTENDDPRGNLVSFLVNNVKEIFDDIVESTEARSTGTIIQPTVTTIAITPSLTTSSTTFRSNITISSTEVSITSTTPMPLIRVTSAPPNYTTLISSIYTTTTTTTSVSTNSTDVIYANLTLTTLLDAKRSRQSELTKRKGVAKTDKLDHDIQMLSQIASLSPNTGNTSDPYMEHDTRRSCIMCNNVAVEDCNDPKNKLIQSVMCDRDDDLCYSMHTPFGIIDRGCYNSNHNLTTYVCSCNLCNYISISEMPYTFSDKQDWVDNVIEISRTRHFRKSIFKDMSCLRCEVNSTVQKTDLLESTNCLEGSIGNIPVEECEQNEVCAVKAHRADGYIWRGCVRAPLYNYWWQFCDYDLCNYDTVLSLYDFMPYTFSNKQDWADNVIEISRTRHFRKSIFKDMSCLRCEVNSTVQKTDLLESTNCLEGSIGNIPVEEFEQNEVCAVKAHRVDGYIWRGCVRAPLYNYWWQFCDYDLCNYDTFLSLYDFV